VTPSRAPQNKHKVCSCSRLPKLYQNTLKIAITRTSPYKPQLAHSTGLPKPPGYNLEGSRVNPIRVTLVTGRPAKASHHEHHLKLCRNLSSRTITEPKPLGAHLTLPGKHSVQTTKRASHTARHHAYAASSLHRHRRADCTMLSGATHRHRVAHLPRAARRHRTIRVSTAPFCLAEPSLPPGTLLTLWPLSQVGVPSAWQLAHAARRHTSSALLLVYRHLNRSTKDLNHTTHQFIGELWHSN